MILGRQKHKKSMQYEIKRCGLDHHYNVWIPGEELIEKAFLKVIWHFDDIEPSQEGAGCRDVRRLSGDQKVKVVIVVVIWNFPPLLVLDTLTNCLNTEAVDGITVGIRDWAGVVTIISDYNVLVSALCSQNRNINAGILNKQGRLAFNAKGSLKVAKELEAKIFVQLGFPMCLYENQKRGEWYEVTNDFRKVPGLGTLTDVLAKQLDDFPSYELDDPVTLETVIALYRYELRKFIPETGSTY
ncbi:hypothetical protein CALCODRAFT_558913 [Calocera cornea HHB12733]|uniref:Chromo domain-containing protein n=1 Tax=Calocera cornea HHB12733 TaxID=1353952 RepID=A0A165CID2_9BASI|nr:hypothetical protein CALCODRAFT_558913 [Calocera cornea HHB12733]